MEGAQLQFRWHGPSSQSHMKVIFALLCLFLALITDAAPKGRPVANVTNAPACIELKDQFETLQKITFPTTNLTILTIADHEGSEQIAGWVAPVTERYGMRVAISGIADVSAVPGWLRGVVRKKFKKRQTYPIMLDWSGDTVKAFAPVSDCCNIFVLDEQGRILKRFIGEAKPVALEELYATIDQALPGNASPVAKK
jgi:hypothetical protein